MKSPVFFNFFRVVAMVVILLCSSIGCRPVGEKNTLIVKLGERTDKCKGCSWPKQRAENMSNQLVHDLPVQLLVVFNKKELVVPYSKLTILQEKNDVVRKVTFLPQETTEEYRETVSSIRLFLKNADIDSVGGLDEKLRELEKKEISQDPFGRVSVSHVLGGEVEMLVEIKPSSTGDGWFSSINLFDLNEFDTE